MPLTVGVIVGAFVASYMLAALITETKIGRPSSTASIGFFLVPIYSGIVALGGIGIGFLIRAVLRGRGEKDLISIKGFFIKSAIVLVITSGLAIAIGTKEVVDYEAVNAPQVLSNSGSVNRAELSREDVPSVEKHAKLIWDFENKALGSVLWNGAEVIANVAQSTKLSLKINDKFTLQYDFKPYTYLTEITALQFPTISGEDEYLVVLARLRATSFRSMLLIYEANGKLVHEELLKRCGRKQYMGLVNGIDGQYLVVDICSPFTIQSKRPNQQLQATQKPRA